MKKIATILFSICCSLAYAQKYDYNAANAGTIFKLKGSIVVGDTTTSIFVETKEGLKSTLYSNVKKVNGTIYITDGVMTHWLTISDKKGTANGYQYSKVICLNMDSKQGAAKILYYVNEK